MKYGIGYSISAYACSGVGWGMVWCTACACNVVWCGAQWVWCGVGFSACVQCGVGVGFSICLSEPYITSIPLCTLQHMHSARQVGNRPPTHPPTNQPTNQPMLQGRPARQVWQPAAGRRDCGCSWPARELGGGLGGVCGAVCSGGSGVWCFS